MSVYSNRIQNTKKSFIREILKVTQDKEIISFAGGLPNPISFPTLEIEESVKRVLKTQGNVALQYATTEGHKGLREWIAKRYQLRHGLELSYEDILITTGSQQALDLLGKVLINPGDIIGVEVPGYLGAIQSFSMFEPNFIGVNLTLEGLDSNDLKRVLDQNDVKLLYTVPNFQNPSGITYSKKNREQVANVLKDRSTFIIEDDPYGELRFKGKELPYIASNGLNNSILLGSISKIITPGMRIGWICTKNTELMSHLVVAKQAADLHTNYFSQCIIADYLEHYDLDSHIEQIRKLYLGQSNAMIAAMEEYFPKEVTFTKPEGGMFLWASLPEGMDSTIIFERAMPKKVTFVPGNPFYTHDKPVSTMRLNYTNADVDVIYEGIRRLASVIY